MTKALADFQICISVPLKTKFPMHIAICNGVIPKTIIPTLWYCFYKNKTRKKTTLHLA